MTTLLFLAHRIPYPPNKGDKIRSYHLLRHLAKRHRVLLGAFIDDPADLPYVDTVKALCANSFLPQLDPTRRKLVSVSGLWRGEALSLPFYRRADMQQWVDRMLREEAPAAVIAYSSPMAQFVESARFDGLKRIIDFVDVDSDKWRQYAQRGRPPMSWVYAREARRLLAFEQRIARRFDASLLVSEPEAQLLREWVPDAADRIGHYQNGVDTEYFDPSVALDDPFSSGGPVVVFTGAMDYWPNIEAVQWFVDAVLPLLRSARSDIRLAIVGSNPTEAVRDLGRVPGVIVTGRVPDVRPYLRHAAVAIAPLRIARGVQNKVLEALAMARPIVCSPQAAEGLQPADLIDAALADTAELFCRQVLSNLDRGEVFAHRQYVLARYGWEANLAVIDELLGDTRQFRRTGGPSPIAGSST